MPGVTSPVDPVCFCSGGLFLDTSAPTNLARLISGDESSAVVLRSKLRMSLSRRVAVMCMNGRNRRNRGRNVVKFMSLSVSVKNEESDRGSSSKSNVVNTTKHLWAGAVAAMVSRTVVAPLERLKLEYMIRGEQRKLPEAIHAIAVSQGLKGFWRGNFVNILRTAPFKAINFYAYDTYRKHLLRISGDQQTTTNLHRMIAGAAAGITATIICIPMDTIRTKMVAPGGEALGGIVGVFYHMVQTEGFFSLYKGLLTSIISMAPSGAVFYSVYDILKSAYIHSPEGMRRRSMMMKSGGSRLDQLELSPARTLLYGAISGCCAEVTTFPFEVVRRQLQMQVRANRLNAFATCVMLVEQGGVAALYSGLFPSLLQVLPSAAITFFVYELMKKVLEVE